MATLNEIMWAVSREFEVLPDMIAGKRRVSQKVIKARQTFYYVARECSGQTHSQIGRYINRDHTTIMHGCKSLECKMEHDEELKNQVDALIMQFGVAFLPHKQEQAPKLTQPFYKFKAMCEELGYEIIIRKRTQARSVEKQETQINHVLPKVRDWS